MRRHLAMVSLFVVPLAMSALASAQPGRGPGPAPSASGSGTTVAAASTTTAPSAPTTPPPADTARGGLDGSGYAVRLRDLEQRVDELKDQIRRSHTRLALLLSDTIIGGGAAGSRSEIEFENEMSSAFRLTQALFVIDGQVQYNRSDDTGALADQKEIPVYSGSVPPGDHTIQVVADLPGQRLRRLLLPAGLQVRGEVEPRVHRGRGQDHHHHGHRLREGRRDDAARAAARDRVDRRSCSLSRGGAAVRRHARPGRPARCRR